MMRHATVTRRKGVQQAPASFAEVFTAPFFQPSSALEGCLDLDFWRLREVTHKFQIL